MLKNTVFCVIACIIFVSCTQKGESYFLSFWNSFPRRALQNVPVMGTSKCTTPVFVKYTIPCLICS